MTTNAYWAELEHQETADTRAFWVELESTSDSTTVFWAELESSSAGSSALYAGVLPEVTTITVVGTASPLVGQTADLVVTVEDENGDPIPNVMPAVASSNTGIATVALLAATAENGEAIARVTALAAGTVTITATLDGIASTRVATIHGNPEPEDPVEVIEVTTVTLSVPTISLEVGTTGWATVTVLDQNSNPVPGVTVAWSSSADAVIADPAAGTTNAAGQATVSLPALAAGSTTIGATAEGVSATGVAVTVFAVTPPPTYSGSGSAQVVVTAESRLAGWERARVRRFNDADQRKQHPTDRFFEGMVEGVETEVVWPSKEVLRRFS